MGRTRKDSQQGSYIDVVKRDDGSFDLFRNREVIGEHMDELWLRHELCVRFGYCQGEDDSILE
jgi:hypothetical protein